MKLKEKILLLEIEELVAVISAFLLVAAVFLPWGKTENVNILGIEGKDSMITIGMGLMTLVLLLVKRISIIVPLFFGLFTLFIGGYDFVKMEKVTTALNGQVGIGLYLTIIASFGVIVGAAINAIRKKKNKKRSMDSSHGGGFRALASFLLFTIIFSGFSGWPMPKVALAAFDGGDGTIGTPYQISTCSQLQEMSGDVTANYILTGNVDCSATSGWNGGWGFLPVGSTGTPFSGTLNGHNYNISGFVIARAISYPSTNNQALFGDINSTAVISNVSMTGVSVTGAGYVAGLVAYNDHGTITNCSVAGSVSGYLAGGLLVGGNYYGTILNSHTSGTATVSYMAAGGLAGQSLSGTISSSYSTADVSASDSAGGLVGQNTDIGSAHVSVINSYSRGNVTTSGSSGGLIGNSSYTSVENSYSTGTVAGSPAKGFSGWCNHNYGSPDSFVDNFWDTDTTGLFSTSVGNCGSVTGLLGKTTLQMKDVATYTTVGGGLATAWDFVGTPNNDAGHSDIWAIDPLVNDGYPHLTAFDPPIGTVLSPSDNATGVSTSTNLVLTLNKNVTAVAGKNIVVKQGLTTIESDDVTNLARVTVAGNIVTIDLSVTLDPSTEYNVLIDSGAFVDEMGMSYAGISDSTTWNFTTVTPDVTAPSITTLTPLDNATGVSPNTNLTINFDENVVAVAGKYIVVKQGGTVVESVDVTNGSKVTVTGASVEVNLATTLDWTTGYNILIDAGAFTDAALNPIAGISSATDWNFTTATPPVVATLSPTDGATGVSAGSNLVVTFDKNVNAVAGKFLYVKRIADDTTFESVAVDGIKVSILNAIVVIDLNSNLDYSTGYYVTMDAGAFEDTFGNPFAGIASSTTWNFATGAAPDVTPPSVSTLLPADEATGVSRTTDLTLTFTENVTPIAAKYITVMQGGSTIQSSEATNGAVVVVADNVVTMHLAAPLDYSTSYHVLVDVGAFEDGSGNPFAGIADSTTWNFDTGAAPDVTPPSVTSITPADNATGVSITTGLTVVFDENVIAVGGKNMYVMNGGTTVATIAVDGGSVSVLGGTVAVTLPSSLAYSTAYHMIIDSGAFTDASSNPITGIADSTTWNFTTLDDPTPPDSTPPSVSSFSPLDNATGVSPAATLTINFGENVSAVADKHIYVMQGESVFQTITATNTDDVSISGSTVILHMGSLLDYTTEYHVLMDVGTFEDAAHNPYAGIADATTWSFTVVTPVSISTCTELQAISENLAGHYILTGDVDCQTDTHAGGALWNGGLGFEPLGTVNPGVQFTGTFNGQKYAVKNLFINRPAANGVGLFGGLGDGGLIIYTGVQNANITGDNGVGGLLGYSGSGANVYFSYSTGTVTGLADYDGGLIGYNDTGAFVGGSYSTANVSGASYVGGFVGYNKSSTNGGVSSSYSSGNVVGTSGGVGGFVGNNEGTVGNSYSLGTVSGGSAKGFCGANTGTVSASGWDTETSGRGDSDGGVAKTTLEMKTGSTFTDAGWDFSSIWNIGTSTNNGYPYFRWVEFPNVGFSTTSASGLESVTSVNLPLTLSSSFPWSVTVDYAVTGGTATGSGADYTLASGTATIAAGETSVNVLLTVVNGKNPWLSNINEMIFGKKTVN
ncbi:MAG: Ig-like domain-containing protein [Candidatus Peregrinibacteria bacterium]|nr:Ig-like domain-containing protein [Candidatus Peregrinibacteria bacterium]